MIKLELKVENCTEGYNHILDKKFTISFNDEILNKIKKSSKLILKNKDVMDYISIRIDDLCNFEMFDEVVYQNDPVVNFIISRLSNNIVLYYIEVHLNDQHFFEFRHIDMIELFDIDICNEINSVCLESEKSSDKFSDKSRFFNYVYMIKENLLSDFDFKKSTAILNLLNNSYTEEILKTRADNFVLENLIKPFKMFVENSLNINDRLDVEIIECLPFQLRICRNLMSRKIESIELKLILFETRVSGLRSGY